MMGSLFSFVRAPIMLLLLFTVLLGAVYPLVVTVVAQGAFGHKTAGSLLTQDGKVIGSELLGQYFVSPKYFWGRPSATQPAYNAASSGGSNLSPANPKLVEAVNARIQMLKKHDPKNIARIPVDLVTASASGLDPHISVASALYQVPRVARQRHMSEEALMALVERFSEPRLFGVFGEPRVNVLLLNMALDRESAK